MKAHELATLNEYKQENAELKRTCEGLRSRNTTLTERIASLLRAHRPRPLKVTPKK